MATYPLHVLRKLQLTELEILKTIRDIGSENNIEWFLDSGTALGAKRHNGFIPWDDDADVGMLRDDYDKFLKIADAPLKNRGYQLVTPGAQGSSCQFSKICKIGTRFWTQETIDAHFNQGIFVDIFPYDRISNDPSVAKKQLNVAKKWSRLSYLHGTAHITLPDGGIIGAIESALCNIAHPIVHSLYSQEQINANFEKARKLAKSNEDSHYLALAYPYTPPLEKSTLLPTSKLEFEGSLFPVPCDIETYLTALYGKEWNQLPPESERKNHAPIVLDFGDGVNALSTSSDA